MMASHCPNHDGVDMLYIRRPIIVAFVFAALAGLAPIHVSLAVASGHPGCANITYETPKTPECDAVMAAQPYPDVTPIP